MDRASSPKTPISGAGWEEAGDGPILTRSPQSRDQVSVEGTAFRKPVQQHRASEAHGLRTSGRTAEPSPVGRRKRKHRGTDHGDREGSPRLQTQAASCRTLGPPALTRRGFLEATLPKKWLQVPPEGPTPPPPPGPGGAAHCSPPPAPPSMSQGGGRRPRVRLVPCPSSSASVLPLPGSLGTGARSGEEGVLF